MARIALIDGHPDPARGHYINALADAYARGAASGGHEIRRINLSDLSFEMLRSHAQWLGEAPEAIRPAQQAMLAADHIVIAFPLWLGGMPAVLRAFLEQASCGGAFIEDRAKTEGKAGGWTQKLKGKSARIIVTMGMPAEVYRLWYNASGVKMLERNILKFAGVSPIRESFIGLVEALSPARRKAILARMEKLGAAAQ